MSGTSDQSPRRGCSLGGKGRVCVCVCVSVHVREGLTDNTCIWNPNLDTNTLIHAWGDWAPCLEARPECRWGPWTRSCAENLEESQLFFITRNTGAWHLLTLASGHCHLHTKIPKVRPTHCTVSEKMELIHSGSVMDTREKSEKEQLQFDCQSYHVSLIEEAPLFPISSLRGNNCSVSLAYIWTAGWTTHMTLIYLMAICRKCFR